MRCRCGTDLDDRDVRPCGTLLGCWRCGETYPHARVTARAWREGLEVFSFPSATSLGLITTETGFTRAQVEQACRQAVARWPIYRKTYDSGYHVRAGSSANYAEQSMPVPPTDPLIQYEALVILACRLLDITDP